MIQTEQECGELEALCEGLFRTRNRARGGREIANVKMQNVHKEDTTQETVRSCAVQFGAQLFWSAHIRVAVERQDDDVETTNRTGGI